MNFREAQEPKPVSLRNMGGVTAIIRDNLMVAAFPAGIVDPAQPYTVKLTEHGFSVCDTNGVTRVACTWVREVVNGAAPRAHPLSRCQGCGQRGSTRGGLCDHCIEQGVRT